MTRAWFVPPLRFGDRVLVSAHGQTRIAATVGLASDNGRSLVLLFEGGLFGVAGGGYVGAMPVLQDDAGRWSELLNGVDVIIERATYQPDQNGECVHCDEPADAHSARGDCPPTN